MKRYVYEFIYLDRKGNELKKEMRVCSSKKSAINVSKSIFANSLMNDLHRIKTRKTPIYKYYKK